MNEYEMLGKLAYEAYQKVYPSMYLAWDRLNRREVTGWIAAACAVAEHVMQETRTAEEASE